MRPWFIGSLFLIWWALSAHQVKVWASDESLWLHAALVSPDLIRPRINLASARLDRGDWVGAAVVIDWTLEGLDTPRWHTFTPQVEPLVRQQIWRIELSQPACAYHRSWWRYC